MKKSHSIVKKLNKEVIIEVEEETTQVESSIHKLEEPIGGQQKNIGEDDQLKFQVHNLEYVAEINEDNIANTFDEDTNQEEGKCVVEKKQTPIDVHEETR